MAGGVIFTTQEARRTQRVVENVESRTFRTLPPLARVVRGESPRTGSCPNVHFIGGAGDIATSGTLDATWTIDGTSADITIDYDSTAAEMETAIISGHSKVSSGDVECFHGPFPNTEIHIKWTGTLADEVIEPPEIDNTSVSPSGAGFRSGSYKAATGQ